MHSKVFSSLHTRHKSQKNKDGSPKNAAAHVYHKIIYMGSRPGVDLTPIPTDILDSDPADLLNQNMKASKLYDACTQPSADEINGLWGNFDVSSLKGAARIAAHQTDLGKTVFDGVVSLREDDAVELGYDQKKNWFFLTQKAMPEVAEILGVPLEAFTWCAALHMTPGHIHFHYEAWSYGKEIRKAFVSTAQNHRIREVFSKIIFEQERLNHIQDETLQRETLVSLADQLSKEAVKLALHPDQTYVPEVFSRKELTGFTDKLLLLSRHLPQKGKLQYGYLPPKIKQLVDRLVDSTLSIGSLADPYQKFLHAAAGKSLASSAGAPEVKVSVFKAGEDVRRRLANRILGNCGRLMENREALLEQWAAHFPADDSVCEDPFDPWDSDPGTPEEPETGSLCFLPKADQDASVLWTRQYNKARKLLSDASVPDKAEALSLLAEEADGGNALACESLARLYEKGAHVEKSPEKAGEYYQKAYYGFSTYLDNPEWSAILSDRLKDPDGYLHSKLGNYCELGMGMEQNRDLAIAHYKKAAGIPYADYALGKLYLHDQDAEASPETQKTVLEKCAVLYKRAADSGYGPAAYAYARLAEKEPALNIPLEQAEEYYKTAFSLYRDQASAGAASDSSLYRLGTMYYSGKGAAADPEEAYRCFLKAAAGQHPLALYALGKTCADRSSPHYDVKRAAEMFTRAAGRGNAFAHLELGKLYLLKNGPLFHTSLAIKELEEALPVQPAQANYFLGRLCCDKDSGCFNPGKAIHHLLAASRLGNDAAVYALGKLYLDESLPSFQFHTGLELIRQSAEGGNPFAQIRLGCLYLWGRGSDLAPNESLGRFWLHKAMEQDNELAKEFAQKTLNMYQNYRNRIGLGLACRLLLDAAQIISSQKRQLSDPYAAIASKVKTRESIKDSKKKKDREK